MGGRKHCQICAFLGRFKSILLLLKFNFAFYFDNFITFIMLQLIIVMRVSRRGSRGPLEDDLQQHVKIFYIL